MVGTTGNGSQAFTDLNAAYLQDLYERYLADPAAVPAETRQFFERQGEPVHVPLTVITATPPSADGAPPGQAARLATGLPSCSTSVSPRSGR